MDNTVGAQIMSEVKQWKELTASIFEMIEDVDKIGDMLDGKSIQQRIYDALYFDENQDAKIDVLNERKEQVKKIMLDVNGEPEYRLPEIISMRIRRAIKKKIVGINPEYVGNGFPMSAIKLNQWLVDKGYQTENKHTKKKTYSIAIKGCEYGTEYIGQYGIHWRIDSIFCKLIEDEVLFYRI